MIGAVGTSTAGCDDSTRTGKALIQDGPQSQTTLGLTDVRAGDEVMFALPAFHNGTDRPVKIRKVRVEEVPDGLELIDYRTVSFDDTDGMLLTWDSRTSGLPEVLTRSRPGVDGLLVPPNSIADRYALVHLRVAKKPAGPMDDVVVEYKQGSETYRQVMKGKWAIEMEGETPQPNP